MRKHKIKVNRRRRKKQRQLHIPKLIKYKRYFQHSLKGNATISTLTKLRNGIIGLRACESGYLTLTHYEMLRKFLNPITKNKDRIIKITNLWVNFFTDRAMTAKSLQSRMGRGKGLPVLWYSKIYNGQILLEIRSNIDIIKSKNALLLISKKLPLLTQIITLKEPSLIRKYNLLPPNLLLEQDNLSEKTETAKKLAFQQKRAKKPCYIA
jgi:large subunit ribosomal protein L16